MITAKKLDLFFCSFCERQSFSRAGKAAYTTPPPVGSSTHMLKRPILHRGRWRKGLFDHHLFCLPAEYFCAPSRAKHQFCGNESNAGSKHRALFLAPKRGQKLQSRELWDTGAIHGGSWDVPARSIIFTFLLLLTVIAPESLQLNLQRVANHG